MIYRSSSQCFCHAVRIAYTPDGFFSFIVPFEQFQFTLSQEGDLYHGEFFVKGFPILKTA